MVAIRGHFDGKVFVPDEPVDLPRGQEVLLHIYPNESQGPAPTEHFLEWVVKNLVAKTDLPNDGAEQHDHYLYGTPKRDPVR
jgi:hypothetical protein